MRERQVRGVWPLLATLAVCAGPIAAVASCADDTTPLVTIDEPPDAGCIRAAEPRSFEVYFVIDVSGSMGPFLTDLKSQLVTFASSFKELDPEGRPVRIDYYVVAFVNDVKWYGGRMTSVIALQDAFEDAIARGQTNFNLNQNRFNAEPEENMLDALQEVIDSSPTAEAKLIMLAADAPFVESPAVLSDNIRVRSTYASIRAQLESMGARVHAFVPDQLDGLSRTYAGQPALTTLPGATVHSLRDLTGASEEIKRTLSFIARESSCN
ncbi:hypothetical protein L6R52_30420 [Myxococcota bacterium]|nr:hypothetical protein [Myxococcota bacterium]